MLKGPHIVQSVRKFYQDHPHVFSHREEHLSEILGLRVFTGLEFYLAQFCQALNKEGYVLTKERPDVFYSRVRIFNGVMQEACGD